MDSGEAKLNEEVPGYRTLWHVAALKRKFSYGNPNKPGSTTLIYGPKLVWAGDPLRSAALRTETLIRLGRDGVVMPGEEVEVLIAPFTSVP